jgi:hypothetical protein
MRAIVAEEFGGYQYLKLTDIPKPTVSDDREGYMRPAIPAEALQVNERDRAWVDRMCTPQPLGTMTEGISTARQSSQSEKTDICFSVGMGAATPSGSSTRNCKETQPG